MFNPRPTSFKDLDHAKEANELLENLSKNKNMPHLLFHGPEGCGKYTRALIYLKNIFGDAVYKIDHSTITIDIKGKPKEINIRSSAYHVELIPSDSSESDKAIIQGYIKSLTQYKTLNSMLKPKSNTLQFATKQTDGTIGWWERDICRRTGGVFFHIDILCFLRLGDGKLGLMRHCLQNETFFCFAIWFVSFC